MRRVVGPEFGRSAVIGRGVVVMLAAGSLAVGLLLAGTAHGSAVARASTAPCARTSQLAYSAGKYSGQKAMVWLADANGSHRRKLLRAAAPVLSPNGGMVAVTRFGGSAGLGLFTVCGGLVGRFFSGHDTITGISWSPDSSIVAAVVAANPEQAPFHERLKEIDVATGQVTNVATGFLSGWGGPSFSPGSSHQLAYANVTEVGHNASIWSVTPGQPSVQADHERHQSVPGVGTARSPVSARAQQRQVLSRSALRRSFVDPDEAAGVAGGSVKRRHAPRGRECGLRGRVAGQRQPVDAQGCAPVPDQLRALRDLSLRWLDPDLRLGAACGLRRSAERDRDGSVLRRQADVRRRRHRPRAGRTAEQSAFSRSPWQPSADAIEAPTRRWAPTPITRGAGSGRIRRRDRRRRRQPRRRPGLLADRR